MTVYTDARYDSIAFADVDSRASFIMKTYLHLTAAVFAFAGLEVVLFMSGLAMPMAKAMLGTSWLLVLGGFLVVSWIATHFAYNARSLSMQYLALAAYVVAQAIIFVPLLAIAADQVGPAVIGSAALVTVVGFLALTSVAFVTRKDFSFLRGVLMWGGICAVMAIVFGALFNFELGAFFSVAMIALAGGAILYDTSNVLHHYPEDRYVGASLQLFASVALLFWYVLRLMMAFSRR